MSHYVAVAPISGVIPDANDPTYETDAVYVVFGEEPEPDEEMSENATCVSVNDLVNFALTVSAMGDLDEKNFVAVDELDSIAQRAKILIGDL